VQTAHDGSSAQYPVSLQLCYKAISKRGLVLGFGQTRMMSSQDIVFSPDDGLEPGMMAEIVLGWPPLLDDQSLLELVLQVIITGTQDREAEASILSHRFRTAGSAQTAQRAESTGVGELPPFELRASRIFAESIGGLIEYAWA
jgi:hypothetical protein